MFAWPALAPIILMLCATLMYALTASRDTLQEPLKWQKFAVSFEPLGNICNHCCLDSDACTLPEDPGPCSNSTVRWYYDSDSEKCQQFMYGGCDGNSNNFQTIEECIGRCGKWRSSTLLIKQWLTLNLYREKLQRNCKLKIVPIECLWLYQMSKCSWCLLRITAMRRLCSSIL